MLDIVTAAYDNIYENLNTGLILVDLSKAFDSVCPKSYLPSWSIPVFVEQLIT